MMNATCFLCLSLSKVNIEDYGGRVVLLTPTTVCAGPAGDKGSNNNLIIRCSMKSYQLSKLTPAKIQELKACPRIDFSSIFGVTLRDMCLQEEVSMVDAPTVNCKKLKSADFVTDGMHQKCGTSSKLLLKEKVPQVEIVLFNNSSSL